MEKIRIFVRKPEG